MVNSLTLSRLAEWIDGDIVRGEPDRVYTGMAALDTAGPGDVSFLGNEKYSHQFLQTQAGAVIVARGETRGPTSCALIAVENPTLAFSTVVRHFAAARASFTPGADPTAFIHPDAQVDLTKTRIHAGSVIMAGARIGDGCEIGPNATVGENAVIGGGSRLMANTSVRESCTLGQRVILQPGAVIGSDGFGYEFSNGKHVKIEQVGIVEIHDDVEIGANTTIDRARFGKTIIGEGTKVDNLVQIGHNSVIGKHCIIVALTGISGSSKIGDYVTIAGQVGVVGHITIGDKAILTARTGVTTNLPGHQVYSGHPARLMSEDMKLRAHAQRLPKLIERVKALEAAAKTKES